VLVARLERLIRDELVRVLPDLLSTFSPALSTALRVLFSARSLMMPAMASRPQLV
jgi:hypothetical protein